MNVFEDLIGELKNENLLEETVMDVHRADDETSAPHDRSENQTEAEMPATAQLLDNAEEEGSPESFDVQVIHEPVENPTALTAQEFYRKRAIDEVSGLQMVDHVLTGVERELMKIVPRSYDDLAVKRYLHSFLQVAADVDPKAQADLEFQLMQETENWCSALAHRDNDISAANLRRFCENSKPALSSQALISLAKFYRNLPHSELVRNKFDFFVTRLFSKEIAGEKRYLIFGRDEMIAHFKNLYADWSSISLYSSDEDNSDLLVAALRFEDFIGEAETAESFDDLLRTEFFERIREFKESANEMFYAPIITAAAVECNVKVGNRIVDLLAVERSKPSTPEELYEKYSILHDPVVSDATSKTTELVELLQERSEEPETGEFEPEDVHFEPQAENVKEKKKAVKKAPNKFVAAVLGVNKWLLSATMVIVLLSVGLYVWSERFAGDKDSATTAGVINFDLENSTLKEHLKTARVSNEVFYGITGPTWNELSQDSKEEFLQKVVSVGSEKGFKKVQLCDPHGKVVAVASAPDPFTNSNIKKQ
jgi:hypothetical protein